MPFKQNVLTLSLLYRLMLKTSTLTQFYTITHVMASYDW